MKKFSQHFDVHLHNYILCCTLVVSVRSEKTRHTTRWSSADRHQMAGDANTQNFVLLMRRLYSVVQKDGLNFARLYFLHYKWYVNDLHSI
jgi:hypothetical protein